MASQKKADVISIAQAYKIKTSSGDFEEKTLITRTFSTSLANPYAIEEIPSFIASLGNIELKEPATRIEQSNALKLPIRSGYSTLT